MHHYSMKMSTFATSLLWYWSESRSGWVGIHIWKSVYYGALFFDGLKSRKLWTLVKSKATVDAHWVCNKTAHIAYTYRPWESYTYTCGLLRCSFRQGWAMRDAKTVGRVTGTATHTFLLYVPNDLCVTSLVWGSTRHKVFE